MGQTLDCEKISDKFLTIIDLISSLWRCKEPYLARDKKEQRLLFSSIVNSKEICKELDEKFYEYVTDCSWEGKCDPEKLSKGCNKLLSVLMDSLGACIKKCTETSKKSGGESK